MTAGLMEKIRNFFTMEEEELREDGDLEKARWKGKLVSLTSSKHTAIILMEPSTIGEAQEIGDHLKNRAAVVINLQGLDREIATRIFDFTSGMAYALSGSMQKISEGIYLFAPSNVTIIPNNLKSTLKEKADQFLKRN